MAILLDGQQGVKRPARTKSQALKPPAWLGGTVGGGLGQNQSPAIPGWQEPLSNTGRTDRRVMDDRYGGGPVMAMNNMLPGGTGASTPPPQAPSMNWRNIFQPQQRPPAYGGSYNPTNMVTQSGQWNVPAWLGGDAETRDIESLANPTPQLEPMPVYPISQTHPYGGIPMMNPLPPPQPGGGGYGFGTSYGGNWRRGGGGGGYGGYGYGNEPAWLRNEMGLYDWNFKG